MKCISWESSASHFELFRTWFIIMVLTSYESKMLIIYICVIQSLWTWCDDKLIIKMKNTNATWELQWQRWKFAVQNEKDNRGILSFKNNGCAISNCKVQSEKLFFSCELVNTKTTVCSLCIGQGDDDDED